MNFNNIKYHIYISKMSSLAEFIPIELVNHILSFRPRHPVAELIKKRPNIMYHIVSGETMYSPDIIEGKYYSKLKAKKEFEYFMADTDYINDIFEIGLYEVYLDTYMYYGMRTTRKKTIEYFCNDYLIEREED